MATNDFLPFAIGAGANVLTQGEYDGLVARQGGFQSGTAVAAQLNKVWRQSSVIAAMIGKFTADGQADAVLDDGDIQKLEDQFIAALRGIDSEFLVHIALNDTSLDPNIIVATPTPAIDAYTSPCLVVFRTQPSTNNTGAMQVNFGPGLVSLRDSVGAPLTANTVVGGSMHICAWDGSQFILLTSTPLIQNIANLVAQSGDAIAVETDGTVNFRAFRGTHDANPLAGDGWPRAKAADGTTLYMNTTEFIAWIRSLATVTSGVLVARQVFRASGTYTPTPGARVADITLIGGGGGGGGAVGGGGGGAGACMKRVSLAGVTTLPIVIGAGGGSVANYVQGLNGGTSSIVPLGMNATGGRGGHSVGYAVGGRGGTATGGDVNMNGDSGDHMVSGNGNGGGGGGCSFYAGGGSGSDSNNTYDAEDGVNGGGGGGGFYAGEMSGRGGDGICVIDEYL